MTPERWHDVERVYHAVLERAEGERDAYLRETCGGDEALRREVDSLLRCRGQEHAFLDTPVVSPARPVGRTIGPYEIQALIAAGGMGEVYRAVDTRLGRTVAIKFLPPHLARDPERRERFSREATIVSGLNHPHICALYDVGVDEGLPYLVMEFVDGETLQARLARGAIPWRQALDSLIQTADALDKAHRRGIVHRDLKPANVMLTKAGVKLLDFGLAAWSGPERPVVVAGAHDREPSRLTLEGRIMGTLHYIAPEQLHGRPPDVRSDIFAFGLLAYEMLSGRRAFERDSHADLIASILKDEPAPLGELVPDVPRPLVRGVTRCLAKDPDERWQTANDLLFQLRAIVASPNEAEPVPLVPRGLSRRAERWLWGAAILLSLAGFAFLWARLPASKTRTEADRGGAIRFSLHPPAGTTFGSAYDVPFAIGPNGRHLVFVATAADGTSALWLHSFETERQQRLAGTEGASTPFWSPDSEWVAFFAGRSLKKLRVSTGLTQVIASDVTTMAGATWGRGDVILFPGSTRGMRRVSANGGPVESTPDPQGSQLWPQFLADGRHFLYTTPLHNSLRVGSLDDEPPRTVLAFPVRISAVVYVPGFVFYVQDGQLLARRFDEERLALVGDPVRIVEGVPVTGPGRSPFAVSRSGMLAWWPYAHGIPASLRWFERDGRVSTVVSTPAKYVGFDVSLDGRQLAMSRVGPLGGVDLWLRDVAAARETQVTFDGAAYVPRWMPDGARILFTGPSQRPPPKLWVQNLATPGPPTLVADSALPEFVSSVSAHGDTVITVRIDAANRNDLWIHQLRDGREARLAVNTPANESYGRISPDGRWFAWVTDQSGRPEVWVARFPSLDARRQVSPDGGTMPVWTRDGTELVYISRAKHVIALPFHPGPAGPDLGTASDLFTIDGMVDLDPLLFPTLNAYAALPNGQRFLAAVREPDPDAPPIHLIVDWAAVLPR